VYLIAIDTNTQWNYAVGIGSGIPDSQSLGISFCSEFRVIICKECQIGILPSKFISHFRGIHKMSNFSRVQLERLLEQLEPIDPSLIQLPVDSIPAIPYIAIHQGFICTATGCSFVVQSAKWMKTHCRERHNDTRLQQACLVQTLFASTKSRYFAVKKVYPPADPVEPSEEQLLSFVDELVSQHNHLDQWVGNTNKVTSENLGEMDQSPWLKKTGWTKHLAGLDRSVLVKRIYLPPLRMEKEHHLAMLFASFDRVFHRLRQLPSQIHPTFLDWIESPDPSRPADRPFTAVQNDTTWTRYTRWWKKLLIYIHDLESLQQSMKDLNCEEVLLNKLTTVCCSGEVQEALSSWRYSLHQKDDLDLELIDSKMMELMMAVIQQRYSL
jgi:hypothetical protein